MAERGPAWDTPSVRHARDLLLGFCAQSSGRVVAKAAARTSWRACIHRCGPPPPGLPRRPPSRVPLPPYRRYRQRWPLPLPRRSGFLAPAFPNGALFEAWSCDPDAGYPVPRSGASSSFWPSLGYWLPHCGAYSGGRRSSNWRAVLPGVSKPADPLGLIPLSSLSPPLQHPLSPPLDTMRVSRRPCFLSCSGEGGHLGGCGSLPQPAPPPSRRHRRTSLPPLHFPTALAVALLATLTAGTPAAVAAAAAHPPSSAAHRNWPWAVNATAPLYARGVALAGAFRQRRPGPAAATPGGSDGEWWRPMRNRSVVTPRAGTPRDHDSGSGGGGGGGRSDTDSDGHHEAAGLVEAPARVSPANEAEGGRAGPRAHMTPGAQVSTPHVGGGVPRTPASEASVKAAPETPLSASARTSRAPPHRRPNAHLVYDAGEPLPPLPVELVAAAGKAATDWARPPPRTPSSPLRSTAAAGRSAGGATASAECPPQPHAGVRRTPNTRPSEAAGVQRQVVADRRRRAQRRQRRQQRRRRLQSSSAPLSPVACGVEGDHGALPPPPPSSPPPEVVVTAQHCGYACEEVLLRVAGACGPSPPGRGGGEEEEVLVLWGEDDGREVAVLGSRPRRCTEARVFLQCVPKYVGERARRGFSVRWSGSGGFGG